MAVSKLSAIAASASNIASGDFAVGVQGGTTDVLFSTQQLAGGLLGSTTLTGATVTTSKPVLDLGQTWNAGAVAFTGLKFNVTNTTSASTSRVFDFQIGGSSFFYVGSPDGNLIINQLTQAVSGTALQINYNGTTQFQFGHGGASNTALLTINNSSTNYAINFGQPKSAINFGGGTAVLQDEATGVLALRTSTTAHSLRVYNTADSGLALPTNYEWGGLDWTTTANTFRIRSVAAGTGTNRIIAIDGFDKAGAAANTDLPSGTWALIHDTSGATFKLVYNASGTLKTVALT